MKEAIYRDGIRETPQLLALAEQATKVLEEILGDEATFVSAEWEYARGVHNEDVLTLTLSDWAGSETGVLKRAELESATELSLRLLRLWGALLRTRNHKVLKELLSPSEAPEGHTYAR